MQPELSCPEGWKRNRPVCFFCVQLQYFLAKYADALNAVLFAVAEYALKERLPVHTEDSSGCRRCLPVHVQPQSVNCSPLRYLASSQHSGHAQVMPWEFIMLKKRKSCQSASLMWVCQMTSAAEENLVPNHMQIGPSLLVMPWCQLWFLTHYLMGFNA